MLWICFVIISLCWVEIYNNNPDLLYPYLEIQMETKHWHSRPIIWTREVLSGTLSIWGIAGENCFATKSVIGKENTCPACLSQLNRGAQKKGQNVNMYDLVNVKITDKCSLIFYIYVGNKWVCDISWCWYNNHNLYTFVLFNPLTGAAYIRIFILY